MTVRNMCWLGNQSSIQWQQRSIECWVALYWLVCPPLSCVTPSHRGTSIKQLWILSRWCNIQFRNKYCVCVRVRLLGRGHRSTDTTNALCVEQVNALTCRWQHTLSLSLSLSLHPHMQYINCRHTQSKSLVQITFTLRTPLHYIHPRKHWPCFELSAFLFIIKP